MSKIKISIIAAFAFTVAAGGVNTSSQENCLSMFFPSAAFSYEEQSPEQGSGGCVRVVDGSDERITLCLKICEIFKGIFG